MRRAFIIMMSFVLLAACGSATEVGNPTAEVPRTITGMIDESTIADIDFDASALLSVEPAAIALDDLTVIAVPADYSGTVTAPVDADGYFTMQILTMKIYTFEVRAGEQRVGDFSFEQDDAGTRGNYIELTRGGAPIDLGRVRFEGGAFRPENEPRHHMSAGGEPPPAF